ncbi:MAG TPA: SufD family Fe-S cluster assembly protein, partial [Bacilli bacterium]|nr:SufD family Fe-S cluster assembly protein [Bacilli bacterium]
ETHQTAKIIIFDDKAQAKADPILAIHFNDVAASHAATVGKVNADHLYYMQSRGISELDTKRLITKGYLEPVIKFVDDQEIANALTLALEEAL